MACKTTHPVTAGHFGKKAVHSLLACGMLLALSGCASGNADTFQDSYKEEASACVFNGDRIEAREEGKIGMQIKDAEGNTYFEDKKMRTEYYTVTIDKAGDYTIAFYAEVWYGKITIKPSE